MQNIKYFFRSKVSYYLGELVILVSKYIEIAKQSLNVDFVSQFQDQSDKQSLHSRTKLTNKVSFRN